MKKHLFVFTLLVSLLTCLSGCQIIGDIFKAGMGVGIFFVIIIIAIVIFIVNRVGKNK